MDFLRGTHSTGVACVDMSGDVEIVKKAMNPIDYLSLRPVEALMTVSDQGFIGHNRAATVGVVNNVNAHPFQHGDITLAHNGTLNNKAALERKFQAPMFTTDSELVCWLIDNYDLKEVIKSLEGAFALTWHDASNDSLNMICNGERDFNVHIGATKVHWASERKMLDWLLDRNNIPADEEKFVDLRENCGDLYTVEFYGGSVHVSKEVLELAPKKKVYSAGRGTAGTKRSAHRPANKALEEINTALKVPLKIGDTLYAYITSKTKCAGNTHHVSLNLTLACDPYTSVKVYYVADRKSFVAGTCCKLTIQSAHHSGGRPIIVATNAVVDANNPASTHIIETWVKHHEKPAIEGEAEEKKILPFKGSKGNH